MDKIYKTTYDEPLDKWFKFPVDRFSVPQKDLNKTAQKLCFKFKKEYDSIKKDLDNLGQSPIQVRPGRTVLLKLSASRCIHHLDTMPIC